ncbi:MAG: pyridoxamine 5'-phosphate oxidase, partial [Bacteroidetes bacterium]
IRFSGIAEKVSSELSDKYFSDRPRASKISAWASDQSSVISNREYLENRVSHFEKKFKDIDVPRPPHWGGYLIKPNRIEFWQGRPSRLHDRIVFDKTEEGLWRMIRLSP